MPHLIEVYIRQVVVGFALSAVFVALLLWGNVANLRHLVMAVDGGYLAAAMLWIFNGIVFAGVQFALALASASREDDDGGRRDAVAVDLAEALPVRVSDDQARSRR